MVLVADEQRELDVETLQEGSASRVFRRTKLNLPVSEHSLDEQVKAEQEVYNLIIILFRVQGVSELVDLQYLRGEQVHLLLLKQIY